MSLLFAGPLVFAALPVHPIPDFELRDHTGTPVRLSTVSKNRPTVVVFLGADCPLANLYAARLNGLAGRFPAGAVAVLAIDSNRGDDLPSMVAFVREHKLAFPLLKDPDARVAAQFSATRTPQA